MRCRNNSSNVISRFVALMTCPDQLSSERDNMQDFVQYLLYDISQGESKPRFKKNKVEIIGLWNNGNITSPPRRIDEEKQFFSKMYHNMQSFIDDSWNAEEKNLVLSYLNRDHELKNIIVDYDPSDMLLSKTIRYKSKNQEYFAVYSDGKYSWHESLPDFISLYSVKPPEFFITHIKQRISQESK